MSKLTFFKNYNNYYNRIVKNNEKEILDEYTKITLDNTNFNPNDDIYAEHVINWNEGWAPDYMMVDLVTSTAVKPWTDYVTGFYWGIDYHQYDYQVTGTPAEVITQLTEDGYYNAQGFVDLDNVWSDYHGEMDREYDCFGFDFDINHRLPAAALNMRFDDVGDADNYLEITVSFAPSGYVTIPSYQLANGTLDYNEVKRFYPSLTAGTLIYNIDCAPNDKEEDSFYPSRAYKGLGVGSNSYTSSWFVMEWTRTRGKQYKAKLKRDILADKLNVIKTAPMLVERAMITDTNNGLLFNPEGFTFNQIKKSETLLRQKYGNDSTYYALYFAKDYVGAGEEQGASFPTISGSISLGSLPYDISVGTPIANSIYKSDEYINMTDDWYRLVWFDDMHWYSSNKSNQANFTNVYPTYMQTDYPQSVTTDEYSDSCWIVEERNVALPAIEYQFINAYNSLRNALKTQKSIVEKAISDSDYREVKAANGKIVKDSDNRYWRVTVSEANTSEEGFCDSDTDALVLAMKSKVEASGMEIWGDFESKSSYYHYRLRKVKVSLVEVPSTVTLNYAINFGSFYNTDSPYNIAYIPASEQSYIYNSVTYKCDETINKRILEKIMLAAGKWLLDVQIMPYFPVLQDLAGGNSVIYANSNNYYLSSQSGNGWYAYYVQSPSFEFNIPANDSNSGVLNLKINNTDNPTAIDYKIENECNLYRICSPNYNGSFDFSLAKNNGFTGFNVDVTLRPYNPYIHINPIFSGLYGQDFNDCRGLVCQGDFSVPIINDQFKNYEIENKNYQQMFNRQMANLDFNQHQERVQAGWNIASGSLMGAAGGMLAGSKVGPMGMAAGAAIGGTASLVGGIVDYSMLTERQQEAKDYAIDNYRFQLGNIQALPTTVNKITPLTNNNKIFPVLEFYSCTDEEKNIFSNYIAYKSMNIHAIGSIGDYQQDTRTFIQATPIRLENTELAGNESYEIFNELQKGVYI